MKVAHISTQPTWRGGEQQIFYLHQELTAKNINSVVFAKQDSEIVKRVTNAGLKIRELPFKSAYDLRTAWLIRSSVNDQKIDIVHAHTAKAHTLAVLAVLLGMNAKIVVSRRVDVPVKSNWFSRFKYNHKKISRIVCVSEKIKEITARGVNDPSRLCTIYSGVDPAKFENATKGVLRKQFDIKNDKKIIGNVSALADHKDLPTFLQVAKQLLKERSDLLFVIVGEGEERAYIEQMVLDLDLSEAVLLTGFREDIAQVLADIDVFLFTSKTEGLGTTVLDALASGTAVVATKAGGVPEIIKKNDAGILCEIGDAEDLSRSVTKLLDNQELRKSVISKGFETANAFSKSVTANKTLSLYQSIL